MTCNGCISCPELDMSIEQPPVVEFVAGGLFVKQMYVAKAGSLIPQHAHAYDHLTMIAAGAFRVWKNGVPFGDHVAPAGIVIEAGAKHTFLSLENRSVAYCIHNTMSTGRVDIMHEHQLSGIPDYVT